jgi:EAL domain-containing protein (putative c-di-GMP-specific phosphodiesterase class I)
MNVLYVRIDSARFERMHEGEIAALARADLERRMPDALRLALRGRRATAVVSPRFGLWGAGFAPAEEGIRPAPEEQAQSLPAGLRELAYRALSEELGAATALHVPLETGLREVPGALDEAAAAGELAAVARRPLRPTPPPAARRDAVESALAGGLAVLLQPVVDARSAETAGFELLGRGPEGPVREAETLFDAAAAYGLRAELERAFMLKGLALLPELPPPAWLALNLSPDGFEDPALLRACRDERLARRLVLEVTEHLPIESPGRFARAVAALRAQGARLAFDDAGCGFLNMDLVRALKPDIVKLCITVTSRLGRDARALAEVERAVGDMRAAGALALAEGVETAEQARLARVCGFDLAQGFFYGRPSAPPRGVPALHRA